MISDHQKTVSSVTRAWGWSSADTEHLSRPGQRAGKPGLVTSVTSHSALCFRSQIRVSRHRPMMKWALGGASGALHSVGSWRAERRQSLAWSHSPPPQKNQIKLPKNKPKPIYFYSIWLGVSLSQSWSSSSPSLFLHCLSFLLSHRSMKGKAGMSSKIYWCFSLKISKFLVFFHLVLFLTDTIS